MTQSINCYQCKGKGKTLKLGNMGFKDCIVCDGRGIVLAEKGYIAPKNRAKDIPTPIEDAVVTKDEDPPKKRKYTKKSESWKKKESDQ